MRLRIPLILLIAAGLGLASCSAGDGGGNSGRNEAPGLEGRPGRPTDTTDDNTSTFALDVDTASYTYAARQIRDGDRPDPKQIRPEEFINHFEYRYPQPKSDGFTITVDGARQPHEGADTRLVRVGLMTRSEEGEERRDAALTFVIDVSGSMAERGRLDLVQDALHHLVDQLRPSDSVAIVAFNDRAKVLREMTRAADKPRLHAAIDDLEAGGSTNLATASSPATSWRATASATT